jgi:hypothetical protein
MLFSYNSKHIDNYKKAKISDRNSIEHTIQLGEDLAIVS